MKIQCVYNQPTFKSEFANDLQTKHNLRQIVNSSKTDGYPVYLAIKSVENINSEDKLSIRNPNGNVWVINNTRTNDSIRIYRTKLEYQPLKDVMPYVYECNGEIYSDLPSALCNSINKNFSILYKDLIGAKRVVKRVDGAAFDLNAPQRSTFKTKTNSYEIDKKIEGYKNQIQKLEDKKAENGRKYVLSVIG